MTARCSWVETSQPSRFTVDVSRPKGVAKIIWFGHLISKTGNSNLGPLLGSEDDNIDLQNRKSTEKSVLLMLAPQPGLEPGTYGLTEKLASEKPL